MENLTLLERQIKDSKDQDTIYQPTNYWNFFIPKLVEAVKEEGIENIRSRSKKSELARLINVFGGSEVQNEYFRIETNRLFSPIKKLFSVRSLIDKKMFQKLAYYQCDYLDRQYNVNKLKNISVSMEGIDKNSDDVFCMEGRTYTINFLQYYLQYIYMCRFINFDNIKIFVDLGCGMSKVSEIIHRLYPKVTILLFDIVPTVYFTENYMKSIFKDSVIGYDITSNMDGALFEEGKIYIFPNWKFPILRKLQWIDVFMNSGSFQEMEPDVVHNYLSIIGSGRSEYIYLRENMRGSEKAKKKGQYGSIQPVTYKDYESCLHGYEKRDYSNSIFPIMAKDMYYDVIFERSWKP